MNTSITSKKITSIAIGGFDGMHLAHQELFSALDEQTGAVVVIETGHANMTKGLERQKYTYHPVFIYHLPEIKHLDAQGFVTKLLEDFPKLEHIVVGYDFHFGKNRAFDFHDLRRFFKGKVRVIDEVCKDGEAIHSHMIRSFLKSGEIRKSKQFLGRDYSIKGFVIKGQGLGAKELVPTINVESDQLLPKSGVYVSLTRINDEVSFHPSVTFIGHRVSTDGKEAVETHILDRDIARVDSVEIVFMDYLRDNQKFDRLDLLKEAIVADIAQAKKVLQVLSL